MNMRTCLKEHTFGTIVEESPDIQTGWMTPLARNQMAMEIVSSKMAGKNHMAITLNNLVGQITLVAATIGKIGEFMHCVNLVKANLDLYDASY